MTTRRWSTFYVYLHRSTDEMTRFLLDEVRPLAHEMIDAGRATDWHYLRYWMGGPHLRIRFRDADEEVSRIIVGRLREAAQRQAPRVELDRSSFYAHFAGPGTEEWHGDGEVFEARYEPETDRYGGEEALAACEDFFGRSSELALDVLATARNAHTVHLVGLDFLLLALERFEDADADAIASARGYFAGWDFSRESVTDAGAARRAAEAAYWAEPDRWNGRRSLVDRVVSSGAESTHGAWAGALDEIVALLRALDEEERLRGDVGRIVWSLVHMMNNRLGLGVAEERVTSWLASLAFPRWRRDRAFFDDGVGASDRSYIEESKYRLAEMDSSQAPRETEVTADPYASRRPFIALDGAEPIDVPLHTALSSAGRHPRHFGDGVALDRLANLLAHSVGIVSGTADAPSSEGTGGTDVYVIATAVDGLERGLYRYDPHRHGFDLVDALPSEGLLPRLSPLFSARGEAPSAIDPVSVPAVLALVSDIGSARERFGLRALRLALLDAGHMVQNITLCAAALGLTIADVSAFADDEINVRLHLDGFTRLTLAVLPVGESPAETVRIDPVLAAPPRGSSPGFDAHEGEQP